MFVTALGPVWQAAAPMRDPWKPACRATLADVATAVRVRSRWCNLQHFLYDEAPPAPQAPVKNE